MTGSTPLHEHFKNSLRFGGSSANQKTDHDVVEIPALVTIYPLKSLKQKKPFLHNFINLDKDEPVELMLFGEKVTKGKAIKKTNQDMEMLEAAKEKDNGHSPTFDTTFSNYNPDYYDSGDYMEDMEYILTEVENLIPPLPMFEDYVPNSIQTYLSQPLEPTLQHQHYSGIPVSFPALQQYPTQSYGYANNYGVQLLPFEAPQWGDVGAPMMTSHNPYPSNFVGSSYHLPGAGPVVDQAWSANTYHAPYTYTPSIVHADPGILSHNPSSIVHADPAILSHNPWAYSSVGDAYTGATADSIVAAISDEAREEILRKFQSFKQFDFIEDASDHAFVNDSSSIQLPGYWAKRIVEEWKSLDKDLPDSIFVRVYESRIDLMRAVIIGAEGTPYHDGLFFFDVFFPSNYPNVPPQVHYHSGGHRLNPNLYSCGKICLSLLNTWAGGHQTEQWIPGVSTILQVLVSIQGLILVAKPYFNEPGYLGLEGTKLGEDTSLEYNEQMLLLSLKTMMYIMRRTPKNFEDFVAGYFCSRADDIMMACKAYMEGAQVGCVVKGGVQDVDQGDKSCSDFFRGSVSELMQMLSKEFTQIGAKDCDRLFRITATAEDSSGGMPVEAPGNSSGGMPGDDDDDDMIP